MSSSSSSGSSAVKSSESLWECMCCQYGTMPWTIQAVLKDFNSWYWAAGDLWFPQTQCCEDLEGFGASLDYYESPSPNWDVGCSWAWTVDPPNTQAEWNAGGDWGPCGIYNIYVAIFCFDLSGGGDQAGDVWVGGHINGIDWRDGSGTQWQQNYRSGLLMEDFDRSEANGGSPGGTENRLDCSSLGTVTLSRDTAPAGQTTHCYGSDYDEIGDPPGTEMEVTF